MDQAKEQHIKDLEALVSEYKSHVLALGTEIQELAKRPALDHVSGLQALRDELSNEKTALREARRGMSPPTIVPPCLTHGTNLSAGREGRDDGKGQREDRRAGTDAVRPSWRDRRRKTCPTWRARALVEREPSSGMGGFTPSRTRQTQRRKRSSTPTPLHSLILLLIFFPSQSQSQIRPYHHQRHQHNVKDGRRGRSSTTRELDSDLRAKKTTRRRATSKGKKDAQTSSSLHRQNGRVSRSALGHFGRQTRLLR